MSEVVRLAVIAAVIVTVLAAVWLARRSRTQTRRLPGDLGPFPAAVFFGSESCASCRPVLAMLNDAGVEYRQYTWEQDQMLFGRVPIDAVPRLIVAGAAGEVVIDLTGEITKADVRRVVRARELHKPPE